MRENILTQERLKQILFYNPETGLFNWLRAGLTRAPKKIIAGCSDANGYCVIRINGKQYKAHRLVWLYIYGELPEREIDHINGNPSCNVLSNLRLTTRLENGKNRAINGSYIHNKPVATKPRYRLAISRLFRGRWWLLNGLRWRG
jgi:hypothetical protein